MRSLKKIIGITVLGGILALAGISTNRETPVQVYKTDLDGDRVEDLVYINKKPYSYSVNLEFSGQNQPKKRTIHLVKSKTPLDLRFADVNRDNLTDIEIYSSLDSIFSRSETKTVFINLGNGRFDKEEHSYYEKKQVLGNFKSLIGDLF